MINSLIQALYHNETRLGISIVNFALNIVSFFVSKNSLLNIQHLWDMSYFNQNNRLNCNKNGFNLYFNQIDWIQSGGFVDSILMVCKVSYLQLVL